MRILGIFFEVVDVLEVTLFSKRLPVTTGEKVCQSGVLRPPRAINCIQALLLVSFVDG
jgi:hypothetical protein